MPEVVGFDMVTGMGYIGMEPGIHRMASTTRSLAGSISEISKTAKKVYGICKAKIGGILFDTGNTVSEAIGRKHIKVLGKANDILSETKYNAKCVLLLKKLGSSLCVLGAGYKAYGIAKKLLAGLLSIANESDYKLHGAVKNKVVGDSICESTCAHNVYGILLPANGITVYDVTSDSGIANGLAKQIAKGSITENSVSNGEVLWKNIVWYSPVIDANGTIYIRSVYGANLAEKTLEVM